MGDRSKIEWCDATWNPVRGCTRASEGCRNCYAEVMAARFSDPDQWGHGFAERTPNGGRWTGRVEIVEDKLTLPLRWKKPRRIFVNSTSDLFHERLTDAAIDRVFAVIALCPQHTFIVLTKRPERMRRYFERACGGMHRDVATRSQAIAETIINSPLATKGSPEPLKWDDPDACGDLEKWPLPNVWAGVSVENQAAADERIPHLLATPAAVRLVSVEPLLGPVDLTRIHESYTDESGCRTDSWESCLNGKRFDPWSDGDVDGCPKVDWVICGGESGPHARDNDFLTNARSLLSQCRAAGVPFFGKQNVKKAPLPDDLMVREVPNA